ncbi:MAG: EAL domain-containing protein, partial [Epsilonproteobacteria bacterium]|nr:EAL domain-containing protein [Campylobacterota bacterium]
CRIAIDDFGTGYSNFEYLMRLEPDFIKIDGSIIKEILVDKKSEIITSVIVDFAKKMNIQVIAEYVETEAIYIKTKELGVNKSQGYYFSEPKATLN